MTNLTSDHPSSPGNNTTNIASDSFTNINFSGNASESDPSASYDANGRPRRKRSKLETTEPYSAPAMTDNSSNNNAIVGSATAQEKAQQSQWRRRRAGSDSGSIASSRRSKRASQSQNHQQHAQATSTEMSNRNTQAPSTRNDDAATAAAGSPSPSPATGTMSKEPSKKKNSAVSRFLSFLKCCSCSSQEPHDKTEVGDQSEKVEPAKVAVKPQPARETQSLPNNNNSTVANTNLNNKQNATAIEPSAANSKERPNEKTGEQSQPAAQGGFGAASKGERSHDAMDDGPVSSATGSSNRLASSQEQQAPANNSMLPSRTTAQNSTFGSSQAVVNSAGQQWRSSDDTLISNPQHLQRQQQLQQSQHPDQSQTQLSQAPFQGSNRESIINDQTESQKRTDTDIEMTDAGPNVPLSSRDEVYPGAIPTAPTPNSGGAAYLNSNITATEGSQSQSQPYREYDSAVTQTGPGAGIGAGGLKLAVPSQQQTQPQAQADRTATSDNNATMEIDKSNDNDLTSTSAAMAPGAIAVGTNGVGVAAAAPPSPETSVAVTPIEAQKYLLPPMRPEFRGKKCLVLDLDETLVHSSFKVCVIRYIDLFDFI